MAVTQLPSKQGGTGSSLDRDERREKLADIGENLRPLAVEVIRQYLAGEVAYEQFKVESAFRVLYHL